MVFDNTVGELIAWRRERIGLSVRALARAIGVSHTYLSDVENGRKLPSDNVLKKLHAHFRCPVRELWDHRPRLSSEALAWANKHVGLINRLSSMNKSQVEQVDRLVRRMFGAE